MVVTLKDIAFMRSNSVPSPSKVVIGRIISKSTVLKSLDTSMPTLNTWIKAKKIQQVDHPETGEKALILEDVCEALGMSEELNHIDDGDRLAEAPPKNITDLDASSSSTLDGLLEDLLRFAVDEGMKSTIEILTPLFVRRVEALKDA